MTITFKDLDLIAPLMRAIEDQGYEKPTPIQAETIPHLLEGRDLLGCAQTGTGKTAAFTLPILQRLAADNSPRLPGSPRVLILTPTRELAKQVSDSIRTYGRHLKIWQTAIFGGVGFVPQIRALSRGVDVLVATPGRLLDLMNQGHVKLDRLQVFTLDEADRMLDMGFANDLKKIVATLPDKRQSLFFSATMPSEARRLAADLLIDPVTVAVSPTATTAEKVEQRVMFVDKQDKDALLLELLQDETVARVLVFTRTKHRANRLAQNLNKNRVRAEAIHGNKSQSARMQALRSFSQGRARVLVATDVASRGIDVKGVTHVINYEMPNEPESYVHRIGRTARGGAAGIALSFCEGEEQAYLKAVERAIKTGLPVDDGHSYHSHQAATAIPSGKKPAFGKRFGKGGGKRGFRPAGRRGPRAQGRRSGAPRY